MSARGDRATLEAAAEAPAAVTACTPYAIEARDVRVTFATRVGEVEVLRGVDIHVGEGEVVGLAGESGSGKSVLCRTLLGLLPKSARVEGTLSVAGREISLADRKRLARLRGRFVSMIFQDPMSALDPLLSARRHLRHRLRKHGEPSTDEHAALLLKRVGISDPERVLPAYAHQLSGGLCQRVTIALALAGRPRVLVADEPTTALDVTIQAQLMDLFDELRREEGLALLLVSHDLTLMAEAAQRIAVMYAGEIVETGPAGAVIEAPSHPYAAALVAARPALYGPRETVRGLAGQAPRLGAPQAGCAFAPRCERSTALCERRPALVRSDGRAVRCHHPLRPTAAFASSRAVA